MSKCQPILKIQPKIQKCHIKLPSPTLATYAFLHMYIVNKISTAASWHIRHTHFAKPMVHAHETVSKIHANDVTSGQ